MTFRASLVAFWVASTALAVVLALRSRDDFYATLHPRGGFILVASTAAAALVAVIAIQSRAILLLTFVVSGSYSAVASWDIMRDESSTAGVGLFGIATMVLFLGLAGTAIDYVRRRGVGPLSRDRH
jgi:hypothetical protein